MLPSRFRQTQSSIIGSCKFGFRNWHQTSLLHNFHFFRSCVKGVRWVTFRTDLPYSSTWALIRELSQFKQYPSRTGEVAFCFIFYESKTIIVLHSPNKNDVPQFPDMIGCQSMPLLVKAEHQIVSGPKHFQILLVQFTTKMKPSMFVDSFFLLSWTLLFGVRNQCPSSAS